MRYKKVILTYYDVEDNIAEETLWIEKKGDNRYQIKNTPFFAPNIAFNDIISVEDDEGILYYDDILKTSEHSTVQLIVLKDEQIKNIIKNIEKFGCSWEGINNQKLLAVDIPVNVDYNEIRKYFLLLRENKTIDFKEACLSITHNTQVEK